MKKIINIGLILFCMIAFSIVSCEKDSFNKSSNSTGKGGSMARFAIVQNTLYVIDNQNLKVFDITTESDPQYLNDFFVGTNIETVFADGNFLYIGSRTGMYIYDITTPTNPQFLSQLIHVLSCDPVVTNDSLAFVTLRSGSNCRTSSMSNQLEIIDIKDKSNPTLLYSYQVDEPWGLAVDSCYLFICHGSQGIGVYNFNHLESIETMTRIPNIETYDVITNNKRLLVIGANGFYQFNYENIDSIYMISKIQVER